MKTKLLVPPESWPNTLTLAVNRLLKEILEEIDEDQLRALDQTGNPHLSRDKFESKLDPDRVGRMQQIQFIPPENGDVVETEDYGNLHLCIAGGQLSWRLGSGESRVLFPIARVSTIHQLIRSWNYYKRRGFESEPADVISEPLAEPQDFNI